MLKKFVYFIYLLLFSTGLAWYPGYSVMATDFLLPHDYLAPASVQSVRLLALGSRFQYIYRDPVINVFQNPAYLSLEDRNYMYFDLAGTDVTRKQNDPIYPPIMEYGLGVNDFVPSTYYWSPYRYIDEPGTREPLARFIFLGKLFGRHSPIGVGTTVEYFYDQEKFYQPHWYNYDWWNMNVFGESFSSEVIDPYEDYRPVEYGDNLLNNDGISVSTFLSLRLFKYLNFGARYSRMDMNSDGQYSNMDLHDESPWYNDYLNYSDVQAARHQNYRKKEISTGIIWNNNGKTVVGLSLGYTEGNIERSVLETDSTFYHGYHFYGPDTSNFWLTNRQNGSLSNKDWVYNGNTVFANLHGDFQPNPDGTIRLSIYREVRKADLIETENTRKDNHYYSQSWSQFYDTLISYLDISNMTLNRTGLGNYQQEKSRLSFGADWTLSSKIRFIGGIALEEINWNLQANEPFTGSKNSLQEYENYPNSYWNTKETSLNDDKEFHWYRRESYSYLTIPTGIIYQPANTVEFQLGLTKIIKKTDISEGYDLVVYHELYNQNIDGVQNSSSDSSYVEGHTFPDTNELTNTYEMNTGFTLKYKKILKVSFALSESIIKPKYYKVGIEFRL